LYCITNPNARSDPESENDLKKGATFYPLARVSSLRKYKSHITSPNTFLTQKMFEFKPEGENTLDTCIKIGEERALKNERSVLDREECLCSIFFLQI